MGRTLLRSHPNGLTERDLMELVGGDAEWKARWTPRKAASTPAMEAAVVVDEQSLDPAERIEQAITAIEAEVAGELLSRLLDQSPEFFEQAVVDVLLAMGYGGGKQRGKRIGGTGDGGVDGVIDQDALGLDQIYVQAKRYAVDRSISRETIQAFIGALHGFGASRGVFITTSSFTTGAASTPIRYPPGSC